MSKNQNTSLTSSMGEQDVEAAFPFLSDSKNSKLFCMHYSNPRTVHVGLSATGLDGRYVGK